MIVTFLHRDGVALYYDLHPGDGPAVMFLHGWCCDDSYFAPQLGHFHRKGRATVALDLRGHGRSEKPDGAYSIQVFADDVAFFCRELALDRPLIVGHSMGGIVAYDLAARYHNLIGAFVMIDSAVVLPKAAKAALPEAILALSRPNYAVEMRAIVTSNFFIPTDDAARCNTILAAMSNTAQHVMVSALKGLFDYNPKTARRGIRNPALFIAADEKSPRSDLATLRNLIPEMQEGRTVGSGHFCMLEVPDQINAMIDRFDWLNRRGNGPNARW